MSGSTGATKAARLRGVCSIASGYSKSWYEGVDEEYMVLVWVTDVGVRTEGKCGPSIDEGSERRESVLGGNEESRWGPR